VKQLFIKMADRLESDLMAGMNRLEELEKYLKNSDLWEEFLQLSKHIGGFDTDDTLLSLKNIAQKLCIYF